MPLGCRAGVTVRRPAHAVPPRQYRVARRVCFALSARFGSRTRFWLQFEGCAVQPNERSVAMLRQLGLQIQGADSARGQALQRRLRECQS